MPGSNDYSMDPVLWDAPEVLTKPQQVATPKFDPNAGRLEAYEKRWNNYITNLSNSLNKINIKKARKYFDSQFELDWNNEATSRLVEFASQQAQKRAKDLIAKNEFERAEADRLSLELDARDYEAAGYSIDPKTGNWVKPLAAPTKAFNTNYWLSEAQKVNPAFKSIDEVKAWQKQNGLVDDGMFGKNSLAKWNELNSSTQLNANQLPSNLLGGFSSQNFNIPTTVVGIDLVSSPAAKLAVANAVLARKENNLSAYNYSSGKDYISEASLRNDFNRQFADNLKNNGVKLVTNYQGGLDADWLRKQPEYDEQFQKFRKNNTITTVGDHIGNFFGGIANWFNKHAKPAYSVGGQINKHQQGGTMQNELELQKAFIAFLIEDAAAQGVQLQSEQDLQAYAQLLGEEGLKAKYQEFMQKMQGGVKAKLGAKLDYIRKIKGLCPEGEELVYMKQGGRVCPVCQKKKAEKAEDGKKLNSVLKFKLDRKKINPNDTINTKFGPRDLNNNTKYPKWNPKKENYTPAERNRVVEKDQNKGKKLMINACGAKMKKK